MAACRIHHGDLKATNILVDEANGDSVSFVDLDGAGILLEKPADIVLTVQNLVTDSQKYARMKAATVNLAVPNSTQKIIEEITALLPPKKELPQSQAIAA